jgi:hypothetical protein
VPAACPGDGLRIETHGVPPALGART